ncbi:MAG: T9SS type A sorting domain-containing protein [Flavobacteriales bacterium]|nr:T9SS type A sorting domain-containing protein [Flavobacteriales bacterium]
MKRILTTLFVTTLAVQAMCQTINALSTSPSSLSECTVVTVTATGALPAGKVPTSYALNFVGTTLNVTLNTGNGNPGGAYTAPIPLGTFPAGNYTIIVQLIYNGNVADTETITRTIAPATNPNTGLTATHTKCTSDPSVPLLSLLGGTPDPGGVWTDPQGAVVANGIFDPGVSLPGNYTYAFNVLPPCVSSQTSITVTYLPNNNPGTPGTVQVCALGGGSNIDLSNYLGGAQMAGGTWTKPGGGAHNGIYIPDVDPIGIYTYAVPGIAPCGPATATVTVEAVPAENAGQGMAAQVCYNETAVDLTQYLTGNPNQNGGDWYGPTDNYFGPFNSVFNAQVDPAGTYYYVVYGSICPTDTAFVPVSIIPAPCTPGFEEFSGNVLQFNVMPNPSEGHVTVELELISGGHDQRLDVVDLHGRVVRSEQFALSGTWMRRDLDLGDLAKGAYVLRVTSAEGSAVQRVMLR